MEHVELSKLFNACHNRYKSQGGLNTNELKRKLDVDEKEYSREELNRICMDRLDSTMIIPISNWSLRDFIEELSMEEWNFIITLTEDYILHVTEDKITKPTWEKRVNYVKALINKQFYEPERIRNPLITFIRGNALHFEKIMIELYDFMVCAKEFLELNKYHDYPRIKSYIDQLTCNDIFLLSRKMREVVPTFTKNETRFLNMILYSGMNMNNCISKYSRSMVQFCSKHKGTKAKKSHHKRKTRNIKNYNKK